jgi:hypothetical protein
MKMILYIVTGLILLSTCSYQVKDRNDVVEQHMYQRYGVFMKCYNRDLVSLPNRYPLQVVTCTATVGDGTLIDSVLIDGDQIVD